jgi:hypothetical protein
MSTLEFIAIGEQQIEGVPLRCVPLSEPNPGALYRRRLEAMRSCQAEYLCFIDGGEDVLLPGFVEAMEALAQSGQALGYAPELVYGQQREVPQFTLKDFLYDHSIIHHGVGCNVERLKAIDWPEGCYSWETIAYGTLAQQGYAFDPTPRYDWRPTDKGARLWGGFARGIVNSKAFLQGRPGVHTKKDF